MTSRLFLASYHDEIPEYPLSSHEQNQASKFKYHEHRFKYLQRHYGLYHCLEKHYAVQAAEQQYAVGDFGKPHFEGGHLEFSISHDEDYFLIAISDGVIGCDIEKRDHTLDFHLLARQVFSQYEIVTMESLPTTEICEYFFRIWTRKEAFIKAQGEGLSYGLKHLSMDGKEQKDFEILSRRVGDDVSQNWFGKSYQGPQDYELAVVGEHLPAVLEHLC